MHNTAHALHVKHSTNCTPRINNPSPELWSGNITIFSVSGSQNCRVKNSLNFSISVFSADSFLSLPRPQVRALHTQGAPTKSGAPPSAWMFLPRSSRPASEGCLMEASRRASSSESRHIPTCPLPLISSCMILFKTAIIQLFNYFSLSPNLSLNTREAETSVLYTDHLVTVSSTQISQKNIKGIMRSGSAEVAMETVGALWRLPEHSTPNHLSPVSSPSYKYMFYCLTKVLRAILVPLSQHTDKVNK